MTKAAKLSAKIKKSVRWQSRARFAVSFFKICHGRNFSNEQPILKKKLKSGCLRYQCIPCTIFVLLADSASSRSPTLQPDTGGFEKQEWPYWVKSDRWGRTVSGTGRVLKITVFRASRKPVNVWNKIFSFMVKRLKTKQSEKKPVV